MSDFMKHIVEEILHRSDPCPPAGANSSPAADIHRPNYQKEKAKQRLPLPSAEQASPSGAGMTPKSLPREFVENSLAPLQRLSLVQGNSAFDRQAAPHLGAALPDSGVASVSAAQLIGRTKDDSYVWLYAGIHKDLTMLLQRTDKCEPLGIITAAYCYPGQLFLIDELLSAAAEVACEIEWDRTGAGPFTCKLFGAERTQLEQLLKRICVQLNRRTQPGIESYICAKPSPLLLRNFAVKQADCIGVLEGVSFVNSIGLLDRLLKQRPDLLFQFQVEPNYLLITGDYAVVSAAVQALKQDAGRLL